MHKNNYHRDNLAQLRRVEQDIKNRVVDANLQKCKLRILNLPLNNFVYSKIEKEPWKLNQFANVGSKVFGGPNNVINGGSGEEPQRVLQPYRNRIEMQANR